MNLKNLLLSVAAIAATPLFATTYYVTPEGAGTKDGLTPDNAFGVEEFRAKAAENVNGDVYNFAGGIYTFAHGIDQPSNGAVIFKVGTGATLNGNAEGERTIFSGDNDGNNVTNEGDLSRLIVFQANTKNEVRTNAIEINNIDFIHVRTSTKSEIDQYGGLVIDNSGYAIVHNCNFYDNIAAGEMGGASCFLYRSNVEFTNCVFENNSANRRGGAVRLRSNDAEKGITTFINCIFKNNTSSNDFGGAIFMSHGKSLNLINCTITNNKAATDGAAIYFNGKDNTYKRQLNIINCTIAGNAITGDATNGQIVSTQAANIRTINSIIVSNDEKTADFYFKGATANSDFSFQSGGYNYVGSVIDEAAVATPATRAEEAATETTAKINWLDTDNVNAENTYASIFGENKINSENVIVPVKYFAGASGEQVKTAVSSWGLPASVDVTKDQNGKERVAGMMPGAYAITQKDIDGTTVSVINVIDDAANAPRLVKVANGVYAVEGATEGIAAYTVNGATIAATSGNTIDLSSFANGLYIIKSGNAIFKVMK